MIMNRKRFYSLISNPAFIVIIQAKHDVHTIRTALITAQSVMKSTYMSQSSINEIQTKIDEYNCIEKNYSNMLEDVYGVSWHWWKVIEKHIDNETTLNDLPEYIKSA